MIVTTPEPTELVDERVRITYWNQATRAAWRFCFVYFGLYCFSTQIIGGMIPIPQAQFLNISALWPLRPLTLWVALHVFHPSQKLVITGSGSGDKTVDWALTLCLIVIALAVMVIWSLIDSKRQSYAGMDKWFRVFIRFALASEMMLYGWVKVFPLQMPAPRLAKLIEPFGNFSPMGVLWSSVGASTGYEMFAGTAEILAGVLLVFPRTAFLGALIGLIDAIQIFVLNMTYDVPVKLLSFHLILMTLFLLAPDFRGFGDFLFSDGAVAPLAGTQLFTTRRANRIAVAVQVLLGLVLFANYVYSDYKAWLTRGPGKNQSPLYGIWDVEQMSVDGKVRPPLLTDSGRWRRVIFEAPNRMSFVRMDDSLAGFGTAIDMGKKQLTLTKDNDKKWKAQFDVKRDTPGRITLDGVMDEGPVHMQLQLVDKSKFLLIERGFHWIQEYPFNR